MNSEVGPIHTLNTLNGRKLITLSLLLLISLLQVWSSPENERPPKNRVIVEWNQIAFQTAVAADGYGALFFHDRARTMMHIAQHDAINAIIPKYKTYVLNQPRVVGASLVAAAAQAAHDVLVANYPAQGPALDAALVAWLQENNPKAVAKGIAVGQQAAAAILALRQGDGFDVWGDYAPGSDPGDYQYVPPFDGFIAQPALRFATPFSLNSPDQFRSAPHPELTSDPYAEDYAEVKVLGAALSPIRTPDQEFFANFWYELSDIGWNTITRVTTENEDLGLWRAARLFALVNMVTTDGYIAGWDSKFHYDFWRPYTAIRAGDSDGNPSTDPDPGWTSYLINPPVQDYPSTHSVLGMAAAGVLAESFRRDHVTFTFQSSSSVPPLATRTFNSFSAAALENAESRIVAGIHFRFSCEAGLVLGAQIAGHAINNHLTRLHGVNVGPED